MAFLRLEPEVDAGTKIMVRAYAELSTCRTSAGMGLGPVSWVAMIEWARYHDLDREVTDHLIHILRMVDTEMLRRANQAKGPTPGTGRP